MLQLLLASSVAELATGGLCPVPVPQSFFKIDVRNMLYKAVLSGHESFIGVRCFAHPHCTHWKLHLETSAEEAHGEPL